MACSGTALLLPDQILASQEGLLLGAAVSSSLKTPLISSIKFTFYYFIADLLLWLELYVGT
jgi:hypothetical protein